MVHASGKGRLYSIRVVAVPCGAVGDEVAGLSALEASALGLTIIHVGTLFRSEERRVGKECRL